MISKVSIWVLLAVLLVMVVTAVLYLKVLRASGGRVPVALHVDAAQDSESNDVPVDQWDSYLCKVDDAPASVFLDMSLLEKIEDANEDTLYALQIKMLDVARHGMGTADEAEALYPIEAAIVEGVRAAGLRYAGRLRNGGYWQLTFMGPAGQSALLKKSANGVAETGRSFDLITQEDTDWSYYREFLYPNAERRQWMKNRDVVDALHREGDPLTVDRRVDHWLYFSNVTARAKCSEAAERLGFETVELEPVNDNRMEGLQVRREDSVQLEAIHEVTMVLVRLAEQHGGVYDGWETSVERAD